MKTKRFFLFAFARLISYWRRLKQTIKLECRIIRAFIIPVILVTKYAHFNSGTFVDLIDLIELFDLDVLMAAKAEVLALALILLDYFSLVIITSSFLSINSFKNCRILWIDHPVDSDFNWWTLSNIQTLFSISIPILVCSKVSSVDSISRWLQCSSL